MPRSSSGPGPARIVVRTTTIGRAQGRPARPATPSDHEPLPGFIYAAVTRIAASTHQPQAPNTVRLQTTDRQWIVAQVAPVTDSPQLAGGFMVTLKPARPSDPAPLLMRASGLSAPERDVAALTIGGQPSQDTAASPFIPAL